jgi:hypothetical protein
MSERQTPETDCESGFFDMETGVSAAFARRLERERDEAREENQNLKLQLGLWEDGNLISEETLGEIRLLEDKIKNALLKRDEEREQLQRLRVQFNHCWQANEMAEQAFRERDEAHKIAERAIHDLAWFNETNAQRLGLELEQLKEKTK